MLHHKIIGTGAPILILHGVTLDHRYMMEVLEPVFEDLPGWKRIYVDMPGHGQSPAQDGIRSQDDLLAAVMDFVDQILPDEPIALIGLSRGSCIARGMIYSMPGRISGVALIVPGGNPSSDPARLPTHVILDPDPKIRPHLSEDEIWAFDNLSVVQSRELVEKRRATIAPAKKLFDAAQDARVFEAFDFSFREQEETFVFDGPSLIVAGRQDSVSGYLDAIDLLPRFPRATLAVLDSAGHGLALERPGSFNALVNDWLTRLARTTNY